MTKRKEGRDYIELEDCIVSVQIIDGAKCVIISGMSSSTYISIKEFQLLKKFVDKQINEVKAKD